MNKVLVVDDDKRIVDTFCEILEVGGFDPIGVQNARKAIEIHKSTPLVAILLDLIMPDMNGLDLLHELNSINSSVPVIMVTGNGDIPTAVKATKLGAFDFICKPPDAERLIQTVKYAADLSGSTVDTDMEVLLGSSEPMNDILNDIRKVASSDLSVLIQGETGSGKSMVAHCIHMSSPRASKPFVKVDIATIPETLLESELFGYEKGAFTGASRQKKGLLSMANGGTVFIDELENISLHVQSKLLSVIEERKVYPLGGESYCDIDVRIIAASNSNIERCLSEGALRKDLYFRLAEFSINMPPLRERREDIAGFARRFLAEAAHEMKRPELYLSEEAVMQLYNGEWPGNVRELKNAIRRAAIMAPGNRVGSEHLVSVINEGLPAASDRQLTPLKDAVKEQEKHTIEHALHLSNGDKTKAASALRITPRTLYYKIRALDIK
ncbi:sigma-54-dependent transcriptional regulator [Nitrospirota bacterium]